jgi:hypothetical protein
VDIGRPPANRDTGLHYGNPFYFKDGSRGAVRVATREDAVREFRRWLLGEDWPNLLPEQRQWILDHLVELRGKRLGCWCAPALCHGEVLLELAEREN